LAQLQKTRRKVFFFIGFDTGCPDGPMAARLHLMKGSGRWFLREPKRTYEAGDHGKSN
jgi:hypothetical protein